MLIVPHINSRCSYNEIDTHRYPHLRDLHIYGQAGEPVDMIIGLDNPQVMMPLELRPGTNANDLYAGHSLLGWSLCGPVVERNSDQVFSHYTQLLVPRLKLK